MALGELTRQLAQQAIGNQVKEVLDGGEKPAALQEETVSAVILAQLHAMQKALKEDEELAVTCEAARETLRVLEIYAPSPRLFVLTGVDSQKSVARVISPPEALQLVCRVVKAHAGAKPARLRIVAPRPQH
ncbi:MAG: hypothetical protein ACE15B_21065 [Bryobacteraceae bacterium]